MANVVRSVDYVISFCLQGEKWAFAVRFWTGKIGLIAFGIYAGAYYFKYNQNVSYFLCALQFRK